MRISIPHLLLLMATAFAVDVIDELPDLDFSLDVLPALSWHVSKRALPTVYTLRAGVELLVGAMQVQVVDTNSIIVLDKVEHNPGRAGSHSGWVEWRNLAGTGKSIILDAKTNSFCAGGSYLSNGTLVSVGGNAAISSGYYKDSDGLQGLRLLQNCRDTGCVLEEYVNRTRLAVPRWYPTTAKLADGSILVAGGTKTNAYNNNELNDQPNFEYYPSKALNNGMPIYSAFLHDALPSNLFPVIYPLPDGRIFMAANRKAMFYNWQTNTEIRLPDIPGGVRLTYPYTAATALLPMTPANNWTPQALICGGSTIDDTLASRDISAQTPASRYCYRMVLTTAGSANGWVRDSQLLPEARVMGEMVVLPTGRILILNGAKRGAAGYGNVKDRRPGSDSNADDPAFRGVIYDYQLPAGKRMSTTGMPTSAIPRMYHSIATLLPSGEVFIAGSNPNQDVTNKNNGTVFGSEYRTEYISPPYMTAARPKIGSVPANILYNTLYKVRVDPLPTGTVPSTLKFVLMDLGYHTHGLVMNQRYVEMKLDSANSKWATLRSPVNADLFPPGPAWLFMIAQDVPSIGYKVMVGDGSPPPFDAAANEYMLANTINPANSS